MVTKRDPIVTSKAVASVDVLSGGRTHFGGGPGWIYQEMRDHGTDPDDRFRVMRERVQAMREMGTHDVASYHGSFVNFRPPHLLAQARPATPPADPRRHQRLPLRRRRRYQAAGVDRVLFWVRRASTPVMTKTVDDFARQLGSRMH